jgi:hypothetical protein
MVWMTVDVDLSDIDTDDLIEELEIRGEYKTENSYDSQLELLKIWQLRREGKPFDAELDAYLYNSLGKVL